jgi:alpha-mannosidase
LKFQVLDTAHYADGALKSARIAFLARNIPALGYEVYRVISSGSALPEKAEPAASGVLENELYRIDLDRSSGAMTGLEFKPIQWQALAGPANVVSRQEDKGDLWELYRGLDGGSKIAMTQRQPVPKKEESRFSSEFSAVAGTLRSGPVFSEFQVAHPFDSGAFATTVRLAAGMRRIEITTKLVNNEKFVRYQALFPTSVQGGTSVHEIPFGAIERPAGIEFPAQSWVDYGDGKRGVALLNLGLPGNVVSDGTLMLSLLRSHNLGGYGFGGGYEPGMSSETGFQIGQERTLRYALVPHDGDWRGSGIFREAMEFSHPLLCRKVAPHGGTLKRRWGLLEVSNPNVVVSTLKPGRTGAAILRVYEATGQAAVGVKVTLSVPVRAAIETDLLETGIRELKPENGSISFDLHPFEIKSFELRLGPLASAAKAGGS